MQGVALAMNLEDVKDFTEEMFNESPHHMIRVWDGSRKYVLLQNVSPHRSDVYDDTVDVLLDTSPNYELLTSGISIEALKEYLTSLSREEVAS